MSKATYLAKRSMLGYWVARALTPGGYPERDCDRRAFSKERALERCRAAVRRRDERIARRKAAATGAAGGWAS